MKIKHNDTLDSYYRDDSRGDIAILGGSFNPIHNSHIEMAVKVHEKFNIDVVLMPNKSTYYKDNKKFVEDEHRLWMIRRVASEYDYLFYSDMEIRRGGVTHTIDTIRELKKVDPDRKIYFIIGGDSLKWVDNWIEADELFDNVTYIAYARDDDNLDNAANEIKRIKNGHSNADIYLMDSFVAPISSTKIRENINPGISIKNMLPDYLEEYILQNRLYKESKYGTSRDDKKA